MKRERQYYGMTAVLIALLLIPWIAFAKEKPYQAVVVFGDSLSDPGNAYILSGMHLKPPYETLDELLIPDAPYARGGNHFSNGATWIEQLARKIDLGDSVKPAFKRGQKKGLKRSNYAVGGGRAREDGININLSQQLILFLSDTQGVASPEALYVIAFGGNDVRDAVAALLVDPTLLSSLAILQDALTAFEDAVRLLGAAGAKNLLIVNSPDLSLTPAIQRLNYLFPGTAFGAATLSQKYNLDLDALIEQLGRELPGLEIARLDVFQAMQDILVDPGAYGLSNVSEPCVMPNQPPFACKKAKKYLFWDGIHPTRVGHRVFSRKAAEALNLVVEK
ncbi:MAG: SGNH/GDSL hydrolase family protein [Candidatus Thiodiazotropha sp.]